MLMTLLMAAAPPPACPVEQALYTMRTGPSLTARFHKMAVTRDWRSGLALEVRVGTSGRTYWWLPWNGGTSGKTNIRRVQERHGERIESDALNHDLDFFSTDASYRFHYEVPTAGDTAPAHLFIPDLPYTLWYQTAYGRRDSADRSFFDLAGCAPPSAVGAEPDIEFPSVP